MDNIEKILGSFIAQLVVKLRENQRAIEEFLDELGTDNFTFKFYSVKP